MDWMDALGPSVLGHRRDQIGGRARLVGLVTCGCDTGRRYLLDHGASIDRLNGMGGTALYSACLGGHQEIVELLLQVRLQSKAVGKGEGVAACVLAPSTVRASVGSQS